MAVRVERKDLREASIESMSWGQQERGPDRHYPMRGREKARQVEPRPGNSAGWGDGIANSVRTESRGPCSPWLEATLSTQPVLQVWTMSTHFVTAATASWMLLHCYLGALPSTQHFGIPDSGICWSLVCPYRPSALPRGRDAANADPKTQHSQQGKTMTVYSRAKYEWPWVQDTDSNLPKCYVSVMCYFTRCLKYQQRKS